MHGAGSDCFETCLLSVASPFCVEDSRGKDRHRPRIRRGPAFFKTTGIGNTLIENGTVRVVLRRLKI